MPHNCVTDFLKSAKVLQPEMFPHYYKGKWEKIPEQERCAFKQKKKTTRDNNSTLVTLLAGMSSGLKISCEDIFHILFF